MVHRRLMFLAVTFFLTRRFDTVGLPTDVILKPR